MTRYLEIKPGSIAEVALRLRDDYQAFFKKELEKTGKGIAQMTDAEKKAFFNRVDKAYNAKAESYIPEAKKIDELTAAQKKLPPALQKAIKAKEKNEDIASMNPNNSPQARDYTAREKDIKPKKNEPLSQVDLFLKKMKDPKFAAAFRLSQKKENTNEEAAKNEIAQTMPAKKPEDSKTTLVVKPGMPAGKENVIRIPKEKLADYKSKGYVEAESYIPEQSTQPGGEKHYPQSILIKRKGEGLSAGKEIEKRIPARELSNYQKMGWSKVEEQAKNPYAIGMAAAMKATGDKPPLKKSTITKAHDIADKIKKEEVKVDLPATLKSLQDRLKKLEKDPDHGGKQDMIDYVKSKIKMIQGKMNEEVELDESLPTDSEGEFIHKFKQVYYLQNPKTGSIDHYTISGNNQQDIVKNWNKEMEDNEEKNWKVIKRSALYPIKTKIEYEKFKDTKKEEVEITERAGGPEGTSGGGMDALRAIKAKRQRLQGELEALNKDDPNYKEKAAQKRKEIEAQKEIMARKQREVFDSYDPNLDDLLDLYEGGFKDIDVRKGDLKLAKDKREQLKNKYNAIMANAMKGDESTIADQIQKLDMSIKKQEQELIDIMKKSKETKTEAVDPERVQKLNQRIATMTTKVGQLDKSDPANKTKEAILKSDIATAKLRLQDLMQKSASDVKKAVNEASKAKQSYKTLKMSLKKEQETDNKKKTLTDKPITKIDVNPKIEG